MTRHKVELSAYLSATSLVLVIYATHAWWAVLGLLGLFLIPAPNPGRRQGNLKMEIRSYRSRGARDA